MKNLYDMDEFASIRKFFELVYKLTERPLTEEKINAIVEQSKSRVNWRKVNPHLINAIELNIIELRTALVHTQGKQDRTLLNLTITTLEYCRTALRGL